VMRSPSADAKPGVVASLIRSDDKVPSRHKELDLSMPRQQRRFREAMQEQQQGSRLVAGLEHVQAIDGFLFSRIIIIVIIAVIMIIVEWWQSRKELGESLA